MSYSRRSGTRHDVAPDFPDETGKPLIIMMNTMKIACVIAAMLLVTSTSARAQVATSAANPDVAAQRVVPDASGSTPGLRLQGLQRATTSASADNRDLIASPKLESKPQASDSIRIQVKKIVIEGLVGLSATERDRLVSPYEGTGVTLGQLRKLTLRLGNAMRAHGYFLARASLPPQEIQNGLVRIVVSPGRYGSVEVKGNQHYSDRFVRRFFAPAVDQGYVRARQLERSLLTLNDFTDLRVRATFHPGARTGETDLVLQVADAAPFHVSLDYDNYGNKLVGRNRAGVSVTGGNVIWEGDELFLRVVEPFPSQSDPIYQASFSAPAGARGVRVGAQYTRAKTRVGGAFAPLDLRGDAEIVSLVVHKPVERMLRRYNTFHFGLHSKTITNFVFGTTISSRDELRELTLGYDGYQVYDNGQFGHTSVITQGLGTAFGGSPNGAALASRASAGNAFTKLNSDIYRSWRVSRDGSLLGRLGIQVAARPLVTAEQYGVGGPDSVRGFIQSEFLGDDGYFASLEYRHSIFADWIKDLHLQACGFVDQGGASLRQAAGQQTTNDLTGAGVGMRAAFRNNTTVRVDLGFPVSVKANVQGDKSLLYGQMVTRF